MFVIAMLLGIKPIDNVIKILIVEKRMRKDSERERKNDRKEKTRGEEKREKNESEIDF